MNVKDLRGIYKGTGYPYIAAWKNYSGGAGTQSLDIHRSRVEAYTTGDVAIKLLVPPEFVHMEDDRDEM